MASRKNDELRARTVSGSVNLYDNQKCLGTSEDKAIAARLGGHNYNILNNQSRHEIYLTNLRHDDHFVDRNNNHTRHFIGARRRKYDDGGRLYDASVRSDPRGMMFEILKCPEDHARVVEKGNLALEHKMAQIENPQDFAAFQRRRLDFRPPTGDKRYTIHNRQYANAVPKFHPRRCEKEQFLQERKDSLRRSASLPTMYQSASALKAEVDNDSRKSASQRQTESANFASCRTANTYAASIDSTLLGKELSDRQQYCSVNRLENHDFAITKKNNHFSGKDKLTRTDAYYMRPRLAQTNNSVKYDIINNERRFFQYS
eukprot:gnl/MRDRNA2_/MRDRNA2_29172_c0_seq1.p1 gnl/MRDRNA2_/MRDRNA2_29172_c0~~gnl/MRDRNA2_/MRDRNA2_29172_c0_seq1.p1  ORF type:complete len:316 (+),score=59.61 gnl/MRDRNA2_/MRDRNA2_29172_c0_seq1:120-1067(+)